MDYLCFVLTFGVRKFDPAQNAWVDLGSKITHASQAFTLFQYDDDTFYIAGAAKSKVFKQI